MLFFVREITQMIDGPDQGAPVLLSILKIGRQRWAMQMQMQLWPVLVSVSLCLFYDERTVMRSHNTRKGMLWLRGGVMHLTLRHCPSSEMILAIFSVPDIALGRC